MTGKGRNGSSVIINKIGEWSVNYLKWFVIPGILILGFLLFLALRTRSGDTAPEPDTFTRDYSELVRENWDSKFTSGIKLTINSDEVYINGKLSKFENLAPVINNGRAFLPVDLIAELTGATVKYDGNRSAIIETDKTKVQITAGQSIITVNGRTNRIEAAALLLNNRIMSPLGIMTLFGFDTPVWDADSVDIILTKTFQTRRLLVVTNGGELADPRGALKVLKGPDNLYILQYASEEEAREANEIYNNDPDILFSQPDTVLNTEASSEPLSWGVQRIGADYYVDQLLENKTDKNDVLVAVLDTGIDFNHPFLRGRISDIKKNFIDADKPPNDVRGHGTHVSGIIVDSTPSNVKIMPVKVLGDDGYGTAGSIGFGIKFAADSGADVINMSLGGPMGGEKSVPFYEQMIDYALSKNVIVIAAAGNDDDNVMNHSPAYYSKLITVAATDSDDTKAFFSNYGDSIDIAAPGVLINSSVPGGGYAKFNGTSMAAPFVAAAAALLRTTNNLLSQEEVIKMLSDNADAAGPAAYFGAGVLNVARLAPQGDGIPVTGISLNKKTFSLFTGETEQLVATVRPDNAANPSVIWKSGNPDIATVSKTGLVSAVSYGSTVISASTADGNYRATAILSVRVKNEPFDPWKCLLAIAPYILILLLSFRTNLRKPKRSRQFILPLVAALYCVAAVLYADKVNKAVISSIAWLGYFIPAVVINVNKWLNYILNIVIAGMFLVVKGILLPVVDAVWSKAGPLFNLTSGKFYEYNERMNSWVLKDEYGQAKTLWKGLFWFAAGVSALVLALSQMYPHWLFFRTPFYPVCGVLVLGEIMFFLSGLTRQEALANIAGDNDEYYRIANYGILRRIYRDLFDGRILFENTAAGLSGLSSFDMMDKLAESENTLDAVISTYFTGLKQKGQTIDPGFMRSSLEMVNGKSVLLNTPFYRDMTGYIVLPLVRRLLSYEKALIIAGRDSTADDLRDWIHDGIASFCGTPELWKTGILTDRKTECDTAVLRFADVYNRRVLDANKEFLNQVGFVLLIEPSRVVSTGQVGLSLIVDRLGKKVKNIVYCSCDRNCDGLVDTLSHIFKVNLTEVYATVPTLANCSLMYWNAHGDFIHHRILPNIARYLGMGTELSAVALRHQIANTVWVSSERFPVTDIRWIAGQYYNTICSYIGCPQTQEAFAEAFKTDANLWNLGVNDNAFITVEDEFNNLFETTRLYSTRAKNQGFVNVISENYLLRDYMVMNAPVFMTDSKVLPSIVPDYTRTERNTVVSLIMRMFGDDVSGGSASVGYGASVGCGGVSENELKHNLSIAGIEFDDAHKKFCELVLKHCHVDTVDIAVDYKDEMDGDDMPAVKTPYYYIPNNDTKFADYARKLSNAYFIIEDDKDKNYYIGAMLYGHVFQKYLPGQMLTYSGKHYQFQTITPESGVVLRRAADHITGRKSYRQRREYTLSGFAQDPAMGSCRTSRGVELRRGFCDISVNTRGYYELKSLDDLASAHLVELNNIPGRSYRNKAVLSVKLPEAGEGARFTIALLLNEIFITLYPESYHYITAVVKGQSEAVCGDVSNVSKLLSLVRLQDFDDENAIYIIEDCEIDLGLLVSVERNFTRLLEIIADYLAWFTAKPAEIPAEPDPVAAVTAGTEDAVIAKEEQAESETEGESAAGTESETATEDAAGTESAAEGESETGTEAETAVEAGTEAEDAAGENEAELPQPPKIEKHYLFYGYDNLDPALDIEDTLRFLSAYGYDKSALEQARINSDVASRVEKEIDFNKPDAHFCDFCAVELAGGEYDVLADGRERCTQCANSAMQTVEQFTRLYENALRNMETFFGIRINVAIKVRLADARKIAKLCGYEFEPTPRPDGRALAFAQEGPDGYTIYVENGAPKIAAVANIVHELTHIWQYENWDRKKILSHYGRENEDLIYEGMAKWTELQYLFFLNEVSYAKRQEILTSERDDDYGRGFVIYADQYPLVEGPGYRKSTPFNKEWPLELP